MNRLNLMQGLVIGLGLAATAAAQAQIVGSLGTVYTNPISTSVTITAAESPWEIQGDVYVTNGATLTVQPGVTMRSSLGTLVVTRGSMINAAGKKDAPITWTSDNENGTYRVGATNEWGNLTVMGRAYMNTCRVPSNSAAPSASNYGDMEGLTPNPVSLNDYGGNDDNDDSGTIAYCSFRYGGRAVGVGDELNGLSLGAIGRNTDLHHIEVVNNLDDGIEIWGGTCNLKYIAIWNIGDDSLDIDQGWRGKAQFGLLVQGFSGQGPGATQGSGMGDNAIEMDGAERCDWQPVTTCRIANFTVIGSPPQSASDATGTDSLVELRDNVRVQFQNCIFMDGGDSVFKDAVTDNESCNNGANCGSLVPSVATRMQTAATSYFGTNPFAAPEIAPATAYQAQNPFGKQIEVRGCIYYNNIRTNAYPEAIGYGIFPSILTVAGTNHANNVQATASPIAQITRFANTSPNGTNNLQPFNFLNPLPANGALTAVEFASDSGAFLDEARYTGAFAPGNNWLIGWTAMSRYGKTEQSRANEPIHGTEVFNDLFYDPVHLTDGTWAGGTQVNLRATNLSSIGGLSFALLAFSGLPANPVDPCGGAPIGFLGLGPTLLVPDTTTGVVVVISGVNGDAAFGPFTMPAGFSGATFYSQVFGLEATRFSSSNAQRHILP